MRIPKPKYQVYDQIVGRPNTGTGLVMVEVDSAYRDKTYFAWVYVGYIDDSTKVEISENEVEYVFKRRRLT